MKYKMDIPDHIWNKFSTFSKQYAEEFYCELTIGADRDTEDRCNLYKCIINDSYKFPIVSVYIKGKRSYFDWESRKHGEIYDIE